MVAPRCFRKTLHLQGGRMDRRQKHADKLLSAEDAVKIVN